MSEPLVILWVDIGSGRRVVSIPMGAKSAMIMLEDVEESVYIKIDNLVTMMTHGKWFGKEVYERFDGGLVEMHELIDYLIQAGGYNDKA